MNTFSLSCPSSFLSSSSSSYFRLLVKPSNGSKKSEEKVAGKKWCPSMASNEFYPGLKYQNEASDPCTGIRESNAERKLVRLALPSHGRMAEDTLNLLKDCQLAVRKSNPRQYCAEIPALPKLEVVLQRESDVVRSIKNDDADLGIVGYDMVHEFGQDDDNLIVAHDALGIGECHICLAIPKHGIYQTITSMSELAAMPKWSKDRPLRIITSYTSLGREFIEKNRLKHVMLLAADGSVQAAPEMNTADAIIDQVRTGTTLRENNLKEIEGGTVVKSQGVLVVSRKALDRPKVRKVTKEMVDRLEAHIKAKDQFTVTANMRGNSEEEVARCILFDTNFHGLQGPTISKVFTAGEGILSQNYYSICICVKKNQLYEAIKELRKVGASGVLISPLTYIFDEEAPQWKKIKKIIDL